MLTNPMDVLEQFPVRKTKKQKQAFRDAVQAYVSGVGYSAAIEAGSVGCRNIVIGDPVKADYLLTAHYDTCARMLLPNIVTPCNLVVYWGYQILQVLLLIIFAVAAGVLTGLLLDREMAPGVALAVYWILLILMMAGPANKSNVNDNTSGVIALLEILRSMPKNQRHKVCFVLFDLEEAGLIGSSAYRKKHKKETDRQLVLNLDCVGDGDHLRFFPTKKLRKEPKRLSSLYKACGYFGKKELLVQEAGRYVYPSDQVNFPYGAGIGAFHKKKGLGLYYSRIHTPKDTVLDTTNINILRAALTTYICCDAAQ